MRLKQCNIIAKIHTINEPLDFFVFEHKLGLFYESICYSLFLQESLQTGLLFCSELPSIPRAAAPKIRNLSLLDSRPIEEPTLLEPGMWRQDPYAERYEVPGGGSIVFELFPDDELRITDIEGRQVGELAAFSPEGRPDPGALSHQKWIPADGLKSILATQEESARQVEAGLKRRGIDIASARAIALFDRDSLA